MRAFFLLLWLANTLPVPFGVDEDGTAFLDLSKLTKLKDVALGFTDIQRITMTLQTAESTNLEQIAIRLHLSTDFTTENEESAYQKWQDLDRLLLQFWISRSIRPKIGYWGKCYLVELAPRLLPELTSRGAVDLIDLKV